MHDGLEVMSFLSSVKPHVCPLLNAAKTTACSVDTIKSVKLLPIRGADGGTPQPLCN